MTDAEAQSFFDDYARAFTAKDAEAITDNWMFPGLITQQSGNFAFAAREAFLKSTRALQGFYDAQGVTHARAAVAAIRPAQDGVASVEVNYELLDADGGLIAGWPTVYVLRRSNDKKWRACFAIADGEIDAWAARGTPLGKKN